MRTRPAFWLIQALIIASFLFIRSDSPALAQPAMVSPSSETLVPYQGMHDSGVTTTGNVDSSVTTIPISDADRLNVGQIVETQDAGLEIMEITGLGSGTMNVTRGAFGTTAVSHNSDTVLYSDFTPVNANISDVSFSDTGATLTAALDGSSLDDSGAIVSEPVGTGDTSISISDATLVSDSTVVHFDGASYVSPVVLNETFLESTGHLVFTLGFPQSSGDRIRHGAATGCPGEPPCGDGPSGSDWLVEVTLVADREGTISLDLLDPPVTKLSEFDEFATSIPISEVLDGTVTVVSGSPPPPPAPDTDCGGGPDVKMCVQPASQTVGVGTEFSVFIVAQNVYNLGGFEFTLAWDPAQEEMAVDDVIRGYLKDDGNCCSTGGGNIFLTAGISDTDTVLNVNDTKELQPGWTAVVQEGTGFNYGDEEMLITGVSPGAPGSITVIRGYNGTTAASHPINKAVFSGPERVLVQRASPPSPHSAGMGFRVDLPVLHVSDHTLLSASALKIDDELFEVLELPARTLHDTGLTLDSAVNDTDSQLTVTGADSLFQKGWILQLEDEFMIVTQTPTSSTVDVVRGFHGSQAASHSGGTPISAVFLENNTVKTAGGFQGTPVQSHAAGASIWDADGLGDFSFTMNESAGPDTVDFVWAEDGTFLGQTGRTVQCDPPVGSISFQCDTGVAPLPLGPTGSGTLARVSVTATQLLPLTPSQTLSVSGVTLHDVSGNEVSGSGGSGDVRVVGCPDFNDDRTVNFVGDVLDIAKAALFPADHADIIDGQADVDEDGGIDGLDDRADVQLPLAAGGRDQVDIIDGGVDVDENGAVNTLDDLPNVALPLVGGGWDQVDIMDGGVDVDENGGVDTLDDLDNVELTSWPKLPEHDVNLDGSVNFVGDVIVSAKIALGDDPPRCPPPAP